MTDPETDQGRTNTYFSRLHSIFRCTNHHTPMHPTTPTSFTLTTIVSDKRACPSARVTMEGKDSELQAWLLSVEEASQSPRQLALLRIASLTQAPGLTSDDTIDDNAAAPNDDPSHGKGLANDLYGDSSRCQGDGIGEHEFFEI